MSSVKVLWSCPSLLDFLTFWQNSLLPTVCGNKSLQVSFKPQNLHMFNNFKASPELLKEIQKELRKISKFSSFS